jgi:hexosaminidase
VPKGPPGRSLPLLVAVLGAGVLIGAELATGAQGPPPGFATVIPQPLAQAPARGAFTLAPSARVVVRATSPEATRVAQLLAARLRPATGYRLPVVRTRGKPAAGSITLSLTPTDRELGGEGYRLVVTLEGVTLSAARPAGLFYGTQTVRQLLSPAIEADTRQPGPWQMTVGSIRDRPRFAWRGAMLDVARHFHGVREVKRLIDLMALYKLNRLHLHLTDDQGWRIAIRSWPRLTTVGGQTAVGGGAGGYFTQRDYRRIVAYARARFVDVVPEIDMPGHVNAALAAYGTLACDGKAPSLYTGIEVGFSSLCIAKPLTYRFVDDVVRELAALTPGPYVHVGGDEAHSTKPADYLAFMERVETIVRSHGKRMLGWEEVARSTLHRTSVAQDWHDPALARRAVAQGAKIVMSPAPKAYLDMKYTPSSRVGLTWAGFTSVRDAYTWDPATQVSGVRERDILGVEAPLWTETAATSADVDYLMFPRLLGHAEIAWSPAAGRSWQLYRRRLAAHGPRLRALGVSFYASPEVPWR